MSDLIELNIEKITGACEARANLYVHRELDDSNTDIPVVVEFDAQPAEKADLEYPGCEASA